MPVIDPGINTAGGLNRHMRNLISFVPSAGVLCLTLALAIILHAAPAFCADAPNAPAPAAVPPATEAVEPDGTVNTSSLRPMPQGTAVTVKPWDNSEDTVDLARFIEDQLRTRG